MPPPEPGCPIGAIRVADGLEPGALTFERQADGEPLGVMHENRHLRTALHARCSSAPNIDLRWNSRPLAVVRGEHKAVVTLADGIGWAPGPGVTAALVPAALVAALGITVARRLPPPASSASRSSHTGSR